ncbi:MAG: Gx transporter family protein [Candidatus Bipolaricaulota bacterium]|nr:Gx transporter family protein [Candidatus Bipolaricaulota bacterium]MCS7275020.1 Gx transporter family protein [Candidatus Bipolaricaulota bacterium]MDW8110330.1 Gx transporter family protein [Candidatus Bipolaricaulota bacterium]MDW8328774.1 Gx transporter family protein [Candidatus Bipolaricaulota bacterium]
MTPYTRGELPEVWLLKRILFAALLALGIVLYVLEGLFPPLLPLPGAKLGLSNILVLFTMLFLGYKEGILLALARSLLGSFISGTALAPGALLSLAGGLASAIVVALSLRFLTPPLGLVGVSILGAVTHNMTQLAVAYFLFVQIGGLFYYLPVLLFFALVSGLVTGLIAVYLFERLDHR